MFLQSAGENNPDQLSLGAYCLTGNIANIYQALNCTTMAGREVRFDLFPSWSFILRQSPGIGSFDNDKEGRTLHGLFTKNEGLN